jgi:hypothetical protein
VANILQFRPQHQQCVGEPTGPENAERKEAKQRLTYLRVRRKTARRGQTISGRDR